jgi:hypothetical protein
MESAACMTGGAQRAESSWFGDRRGMENNRIAGNPAGLGGRSYLSDRIVDLRIAHAHHYYIRARRIGWDTARRCVDAGWSLAMQPDYIDP